MGDGTTLGLLANLSDRAIDHQTEKKSDTPIWGGETGGLVPPWSVFWRIGAR
jgi:maltooligosyltrehalose trehalohydrolase